MAREFGRLAAGAALALSVNACEGGGSDTPNVVAPEVLPNTFTVTRLTGDDASQQAAHIDTNLVNPWGISFDPSGVLWSANNSTGTSTLHTATGSAQPLVVRIPSDLTLTGGSPTGIVGNLTSDFRILESGPASFVFVSEDGLITAWNEDAGTTAIRVASRVPNRALYTAATLASNRGENYLYATDFRNNAIDVFDARFTYVWSFTDRSAAEGFAPYGIQNIGGKLFVAFALRNTAGNAVVPGVGNGIVVVFNPDGTISRRFAETGRLNAPWAVVVAPPEFGPFAGKILIGNHGDGTIGAYHPETGVFVDVLRDGANNPIRIDGLRGLTFGPGVGSTTLFFSAGPARETHGLLGSITP